MLEYMIEGQTGLSYTPGDIDGLVDRLERLIADPSRWSVMGSFGKIHASKMFSKDGFSGAVNRTLLKLRARGNATARMPATIEPDVLFGGNIRRNETCPCGSGKRFKHCHGRI
jgi:uncharacterized protein YecA (UPF0149 family)